MKSKVKGVRLKGYLLEWAENLDNGDFSYHVKEALRMYLKGDSKPSMTVEHKLNSPKFEFEQIQKKVDIDSLESKLNDF